MQILDTKIKLRTLVEYILIVVITVSATIFMLEGSDAILKNRVCEYKSGDRCVIIAVPVWYYDKIMGD